jgi:hypothetical protein
MQKRTKAKVTVAEEKFALPEVPATEAEPGSDIGRIVEGLLGVLARHDAEPSEGMLSLLTALMQAADRIMEQSTPEETEGNRAALLSMLDHARRFVEGWPQSTPVSWTIH